MSVGMKPFYADFSDIAAKETRVLTILQPGDLPVGQYAFIELYCDDPGCDCRRVLIQVVVGEDPSKVLATLNYGWESLAFYEGWVRNKAFAKECVGVSIDRLGPQSQYSRVFQQVFEWMLKDDAYNERLKRHYRMVKELQRAGKAGKAKGREVRKKRVRRRGKK